MIILEYIHTMNLSELTNYQGTLMTTFNLFIELYRPTANRFYA